ncbi:MAG: ParA family protein [Bacteroidales bacterium]|nr:ParA family protein [Bacteroidales bacterium]
MKNSIIAVANWKGGCGKSLISALFCHYLHMKEIPVMGVDADVQQSLFRLRMFEKQQNPDAVVPWDLHYLDTSSVEDVRTIMQAMKEVPSCVVIDCPGNISDPGLLPIYQAADIIVIPFAYDFANVDASDRFADAVKQLSKAKIIFVPNRINLNEEKSAKIEQEREEARKVLNKHGWMTPRIKQSLTVRQYSTIEPLTYYQRKLVEHTFDQIIERINI